MLNLEKEIYCRYRIYRYFKAKVLREGSAITIITYGTGVYKSLEAAPLN
jgi:pyruvate dehydrogenase E1 component beta subunit